MARVSGFTVFLVTTIVVYTLLSTAAFAAVTGTEFNDPYRGKAKNWEFAANFAYSEIQNVTVPDLVGEVLYNDFVPARKIWGTIQIIEGNRMHFGRFGTDFWNSFWCYEMEGSPVPYVELINKWDPETMCTELILDQGGPFETYAFIYPVWEDTEEETRIYLYGTLKASIDVGNLVTVVLATNASYPVYDIGIIFGVLTGFSGFGAPTQVAIIIGGIWWILVILLIVKLVVG